MPRRKRTFCVIKLLCLQTHFPRFYGNQCSDSAATMPSIAQRCILTKSCPITTLGFIFINWKMQMVSSIRQILALFLWWMQTAKNLVRKILLEKSLQKSLVGRIPLHCWSYIMKISLKKSCQKNVSFETSYQKDLVDKHLDRKFS